MPVLALPDWPHFRLHPQEQNLLFLSSEDPLRRHWLFQWGHPGREGRAPSRGWEGRGLTDLSINWLVPWGPHIPSLGSDPPLASFFLHGLLWLD